MNTCILMGSPRKKGNTASLLEPFTDELLLFGNLVQTFWLHDLAIGPCIACRACQQDEAGFGCPICDDVPMLFNHILQSDLIVFATPIYSWYCTPPTKALLDRLVYGMNKYYGEKKGPALWAGKQVAAVVTCGYRPETGADLFDTGLQRYCKHSQLIYAGMHTERHLGYGTVFMDEEKETRVRAFARKLASPNIHR
ncbi:MAG: flavodoxin family protein [Christensenellaceae bacterium]|jgi:multimeric flavodoxin WrbA